MARILGGGLFGEMRGKLGSLVFARNRAGAYARGYAKPVDPATIAQLNARNAFGTASSNYHGMTDTTKALWSNFASHIFNPKSGTTGVPSGFNAFVALLTVVNNAKVFKNFDYEAAVPIVGTSIPMQFSATPPSFALQANIKSGTAGAFSYTFGNFSAITYAEVLNKVTLTGTMNLDMLGLIGITGQTNLLQDAVGNKFGFKIFMSNPVQQEHMFIQNPYLIDIGQSLPVSMATSPNLEPSFLMNFEAELEPAKYRSFPKIYDWVQLTAFAVSQKGQMLRIGSQMKKLAGLV